MIVGRLQGVVTIFKFVILAEYLFKARLNILFKSTIEETDLICYLNRNMLLEFLTSVCACELPKQKCDKVV